jgi:cytochrome c5
MAKFGILTSLATLILAFGLSTRASQAGAPAPCHTKKFETKLVKEACDKGGQAAAKDAMKKFMKDVKLKSCNACHSKLAPKYELKATGLAEFKKLGGK